MQRGLRILLLLSFLVTRLGLQDCQVVEEAGSGSGRKGQGFKIFKKLRVPYGSTLSLTTQVSRPKIFPLTPVEDAVILDAVVEVPIWMDMDRFVDAMYHQQRPEEGRDADDVDLREYVGKERCFLYGKIESFLSSILTMTASTSQNCILRSICEVNRISEHFGRTKPPSLLFELLHLFLSPSLGKHDPCNLPYRTAESLGHHGACQKYSKKCPINIAGLIMKKLVPPMLY